MSSMHTVPPTPAGGELLVACTLSEGTPVYSDGLEQAKGKASSRLQGKLSLDCVAGGPCKRGLKQVT